MWGGGGVGGIEFVACVFINFGHHFAVTACIHSMSFIKI